MKRTFDTAFLPPNNNTNIPDDDTDNAPPPERVVPTMHVTNVTPHPMGTIGNTQATAIHGIDPGSQPLLVSRGQVTVTQQSPGSIQEKSVQAIDINLRDDDGWTPLMRAAANGDLRTVQALLNAPGIETDAKNPIGLTALMIAAHHGKADVVKALIKHGADINLATNNGCTALMYAAQTGDMETVQALLTTPGISIDEKKTDGTTALMIAASHGKADIVSALIDRGADPNIADADGWTALIYAAETADMETVQALLTTPGISINEKNTDGATALMIAASHGKADIVSALIDRGAYPNFADADGWTALMYAAQKDDMETMQALLNTPAIIIDKKNTNGATALIIAATHGKADVVKALINRGANPNVADNDGRTPLMHAAGQDDATTVQVLLSEPEIDIDVKTHEGATALWIAAFNGEADIVKMLLEHGADIHLIVEKITAIHDDLAETRLVSLECLKHYLDQRQCAFPSLKSLALDIVMQQAQVKGPSLTHISFQATRDQLLQGKLPAADVLRLINLFNSKTLDTPLLQTLAIAIQLGRYPTRAEQNLIQETLKTFNLADEYAKNQSSLSSENINRWQVSGQTLLTRAAQAGDQLLVGALIECGAAHYLPDRHGDNALHAAIKAGQWPVCDQLLALGANPNTSDRSGVCSLTYLAQAFATGDEKTAPRVATLLGSILAKCYRLDHAVNDPDDPARQTQTTIRGILESNPNRYATYLDSLFAGDISRADKSGNTLLTFAVKHSQFEFLKILIDKGANPNIPDELTFTPLMHATQQVDLRATQMLLDAPNINIDAKRFDGGTALMIAASSNKNDVMRVLIDRGADVNATDKYGWTSLMLAARKGHREIVQALLNRSGINIDAKNLKGLTALIFAILYGKDDVAKVLVDHGADVNLAKNDGWTPLMSAALHGHMTIAQTLLSAPEIRIDAKSANGGTALMAAAFYGKADIAKVLIDHRADVNAADNKGWTPLMHAAQQGHRETVEALLDKHADIKHTDKDGMTVFDIIERKNPNTVNGMLLELLKKYRN